MDRKEFEETLLSPLDYYSNLTKKQVDNLLGEKVSKMVGYNQNNPHHCYDLFLHTLHSIENIPKDNIILRVAMFFHDIGKPVVARKKDDRTVFYGHPKVSSDIARDILNSMNKYSKEEVDYACFLIMHHDDFIGFNSITDKSICKYINKMRTKYNVEDKYFDDITLMCRADSLAQANIGMKVENALLIREKILENI